MTLDAQPYRVTVEVKLYNLDTLLMWLKSKEWIKVLQVEKKGD